MGFACDAVSLDISCPRQGLYHGIIDPGMGIGALFAEATDRHVDQSGIGCTQRILTEAHPFNGAGSEVLQEDICIPGQLQQYGLAFLGLEVQGNGLLAPVAGKKSRVDALVSRAQMTHLFTGQGFHLDDPSTLVRQHHGSHRPRYHAGEVQHLQSIECAHYWSPVSDG